VHSLVKVLVKVTHQLHKKHWLQEENRENRKKWKSQKWRTL